MKKYYLCFGASLGYAHPAPERTARKASSSMFGDDCYQIWPSRTAMARSVRMQEKSAPHPSHWRPLVKLDSGEGF